MLFKIPLLSFFIFGVTYPLSFLLTAKEPIKNNFHRFHMACPVVVAGLAVFGMWLVAIEDSLRYQGLTWLILNLSLCAFYWKRETINVVAAVFISFSGLWVYAQLHQALLVNTSNVEIIISILSALIVASMFYAMNLGHFYLNVHGLKTDYLKTATIVFALLTLLRLCWDVFFIATGKILYAGEYTRVWNFAQTLDGFLLWVAIFFATIAPLVGLYFAFGTLKLKNTQATTGILYALLSSVLLGDLACKYYLIRFHLPL